ncbi:unnamed protein product [Oncorhynchus mykiss]|uniref:HECT-type E3 ubiquitin transferase n=1 Tax=Oncorhynchus mykiss TaxID=8022 RepID=A0A060XAG9_ONCMY|nr:unnamed protein product [Oncorhynchus mykiss]
MMDNLRIYDDSLSLCVCVCDPPGAAGPRLFTIHQIDANTNNLPKAHTCFNRIDVPAYEHYDKLYDKLLTAIEETCGFAVE